MSAPAGVPTQSITSDLALRASSSVLGAMLRSPEAARQAAEQLSPTDFPTDDHRTCFLALRNVQQRGEHVDCLTGFQELARLGHKDTRWSLTLDDLYNAVPSAAGVAGCTVSVKATVVVEEAALGAVIVTVPRYVPAARLV